MKIKADVSSGFKAILVEGGWNPGEPMTKRWIGLDNGTVYHINGWSPPLTVANPNANPQINELIEPFRRDEGL